MASRIDRLPRIWRLLAGGVAGGFAGGLIAGLGARGAMRLIGMAAGEEAQGTAPTGEIVGRFTWLGTLGLLWFAVLAGIAAGLYYVWIRRFVPSSGLMKGLAFGGILLTTLAVELMLSDEFAFFEPPILGVSLFALLPLVFGAVAVAGRGSLRRYDTSARRTSSSYRDRQVDPRWSECPRVAPCFHQSDRSSRRLRVEAMPRGCGAFPAPPSLPDLSRRRRTDDPTEQLVEGFSVVDRNGHRWEVGSVEDTDPVGMHGLDVGHDGRKQLVIVWSRVPGIHTRT